MAFGTYLNALYQRMLKKITDLNFENYNVLQKTIVDMSPNSYKVSIIFLINMCKFTLKILIHTAYLSNSIHSTP